MTNIIQFPTPVQRGDQLRAALAAMAAAAGADPEVALAAVDDVNKRVADMGPTRIAVNFRPGMTAEDLTAEVQRVVNEAQEPLWAQIAQLAYLLHHERQQNRAPVA